MDKLLDGIDYEGFAAEQERAAAEGRRIGLGLACYVEASGSGPFEGAKVDVRTDGTVVVATAATPAGQGHETMLAQIVADEFSLPLERVRVHTGDTRRIDYGMGTYGSRTTILAGTAAQNASREVVCKLQGLASFMLEAAPDDIEIADGFAKVKGAPQTPVRARASAAHQAGRGGCGRRAQTA